MPKRWTIAALLIVLLMTPLVVQAAPASRPAAGEDRVYSGTFDGVDVNVWIPGGVKRLRGAIVNPADTNVGSGSVWGETARTIDFAHAGVMIKNLNRGNRPVATRKALEAALEKFAAESGHAELVNVPMFLTGFSKGGGWSAAIGMALPERAVAYVNVAGGTTDPAKQPAEAAGIPALFIIGGVKDGFGYLAGIDGNAAPGRAKGLPWAVALQHGYGHSYAAASALSMEYLVEVAALRIPADADATKGRPALMPIGPEAGWLADRGTWESPNPIVAPFAEYKGDKTKAWWLPGKRSAAAWRSLNSKNPAVRILALTSNGKALPRGVAEEKNDGKRQLVVPIGTTVTLSVEPAGKADELKGVTAVTYFAQGERLARGEGERFVAANLKLEVGPNTVYAEYTLADGTQGVTTPGIIVVAKEGVELPQPTTRPK